MLSQLSWSFVGPSDFLHSMLVESSTYYWWLPLYHLYSKRLTVQPESGRSNLIKTNGMPADTVIIQMKRGCLNVWDSLFSFVHPYRGKDLLWHFQAAHFAFEKSSSSLMNSVRLYRRMRHIPDFFFAVFYESRNFYLTCFTFWWAR